MRDRGAPLNMTLERIACFTLYLEGRYQMEGLHHG
jgi:hypothetical protein